MENKEDVRVLLIEDDYFLRDLCTKKLNKEGMEVIQALDGEQALRLLEEKKFNIILLDIILPAMDGFEVLRKIKNHEREEVRNTPVIMLSNLGQEEDVEKAKAIGAKDFLVKAHFTPSEIVKKVKDFLN